MLVTMTVTIVSVRSTDDELTTEHIGRSGERLNENVSASLRVNGSDSSMSGRELHAILPRHRAQSVVRRVFRQVRISVAPRSAVVAVRISGCPVG